MEMEFIRGDILECVEQLNNLKKSSIKIESVVNQSPNFTIVTTYEKKEDKGSKSLTFKRAYGIDSEVKEQIGLLINEPLFKFEYIYRSGANWTMIYSY